MEHPVEYLKWSTPENHLKIKLNAVINMVGHLDVHTLIYFFIKIYSQNRLRLGLQPSSSVSV